ncbi:MAG: winged helix-turn-helix domain-containing protein [Gammaproteobacteria bacterium]
MVQDKNSTFQLKHLLINFQDLSISSYGVSIKIDNMAVEVLKILIENAGQTVHNDFLMNNVWQDKPSSPEVIPAAISRLRKMFKKTGIGDNLIVTVHKVGYRLDLSEKQGLQPEVADVLDKPNNKPYWLSLIVLGITGSIIYFLMTYPNNENDNKTNTSNNSVQSEIPVQQTQGNSTQLFILRHTEKQSIETEDPELSSEGVERAKYWKKVLQHISFDAIYTTDFIRNVQTAKLIAGDENAKLEIYYPMSFEVVRFLQKVKGQKILIIGHSNTIPDMVNRLIGENSYPPMSHRNYNQMYIVTIDSSGEPSSILLHIEKP